MMETRIWRQSGGWLGRAIVLSGLMTSCATMRDSMITGASVGAAAGAVAGYGLSEGKPKAAAWGALTGAAGGGAVGYFHHQDSLEKERKRQKEMLSVGTTKPQLSAPRYRAIWIPDQIEGDRFIEGHRVYVIEEAGRWMQTDRQ